MQLGTPQMCWLEYCSLWTDTPGSVQYGDPHKYNDSDNIILYYPGENDQYSSYYGIHYPSLTIPISSNQILYWGTFGLSSGLVNGEFIIFVRGYYAPK